MGVMDRIANVFTGDQEFAANYHKRMVEVLTEEVDVLLESRVQDRESIGQLSAARAEWAIKFQEREAELTTKLEEANQLADEATLEASRLRTELDSRTFYLNQATSGSTAELTRAFHEAFGHPVREVPTEIPTANEALLTLALIEEEYMELVEALFPNHAAKHESTIVDIIRNSVPGPGETYDPDLVAAADAVADLDVVVNGAGLRMGLPMKELAREVSESNMSKLGADGAPIYDENGKIAKGPNFRQPDIEAVLLGKM